MKNIFFNALTVLVAAACGICFAAAITGGFDVINFAGVLIKT